MGKGNYYFNANVGYILLEEFDDFSKELTNILSSGFFA